MDVLHKFSADYKLVFVGDASMSPYEIVQKGGSVEHFNEEPGAVWMRRLTEVYHAAVWLNPIPKAHWGYSRSEEHTSELQSLMRISYAVFCLKKKTYTYTT